MHIFWKCSPPKSFEKYEMCLIVIPGFYRNMWKHFPQIYWTSKHNILSLPKRMTTTVEALHHTEEFLLILVFICSQSPWQIVNVVWRGCIRGESSLFVQGWAGFLSPVWCPPPAYDIYSGWLHSLHHQGHNLADALAHKDLPWITAEWGVGRFQSTYKTFCLGFWLTEWLGRCVTVWMSDWVTW